MKAMRKPGWREPGWGKFAPYGWGLLALALILPALGPLFRPGFFVSDDGRFHVYRIAALAVAWQQGVLYPRLFPEFGFGYGQAVLNYYAPLSYYPGALLTLVGFGPAGAAKLTIALGFLLAGLAAYGYGRSIWGAPGGILAAVAYTYFPYHLADAYLRGAIPEHFAFIWPPLILWCYTVAFRGGGSCAGVWGRTHGSVPTVGAGGGEEARAAFLWSALAWAGLVYTHNLTAALMAPVAALYLLFLAVWTQKWRRLLPAVGALVLALCLSAPLWLPFLAESRFVGIAVGLSDGYRKHLAPLGSFVSFSPFYGYRAQPGGAVDHPLSWVTVVIILLVGGLALWRLARRRPLEGGPIILFSLLLALGSAFMVTAASLPVWLPLAPFLAHLQYPWRFLSLTALGAAGLAACLPAAMAGTPEQERTLCLRAEPEDAAAMRPHRLARRVQLVALTAVTLVLIVQPLPILPAQPLVITAAEAWAPDRMWREDAEAGQVGATWTGEFLPLTVQEQRWALGRPKSGAVDGPAAASRPSARLASLGFDRLELDIQTSNPLPVRLHQFHLPAWMARLDGQAVPTYPSGELGLVSADVPGGVHGLAFQFGPTPAWIAAACLAILAAAVWAALAWRERPHDRKLLAGAVVLIALVLLFTLNGLGLGERSWVPRPVGAAIEDVALLLGYDVTPARGADALDVTLYWFALREVETDYKTFVHLLDGGGQVVAQHDGDPGGGYSPTTRWLPGEIVPDRHRLPLLAGQPDGEYTLKAGMYQFEPMRVLSVDPPAADGRVDLGRVRLPLQGSEAR